MCCPSAARNSSAHAFQQCLDGAHLQRVVGLLELASHVASADPAAALAALDAAIGEGVDEGQLIDQLLGIFRDVMVALAGCNADALQHASTQDETQSIIRIGEQMGLETVLAVLAVLQRTQADMRYSTVQRTLTELALVRCCRLDGMEQIGALLARLDSMDEPAAKETKKKLSVTPPEQTAGTARRHPQPAAGMTPPVDEDGAARQSPKQRNKKTSHKREAKPSEPPLEVTEEPAVATESVARPSLQLSNQNADDVWKQARGQLSGIVFANAEEYRSVEVTAAGQFRILFTEQYKICKSVCARPENARQISEAIAAAVGREIRVEFDLIEEEEKPEPVVPRATQRQESRLAVAESPLVRRAQELFGARPTTIEQKK